VVWLGNCVYRRVIPQIASTPLLEATQAMPMPLRIAAQSKQVSSIPAKSQEPTLSISGKGDTAQASLHASKSVSSAFNQMVAQIVAESSIPETVPVSVVQVPTAPVRTGKLMPKATTVSDDQPSEPSAPASIPPLAVASVVPAVGRRQDTHPASSMNDKAVTPPTVVADVTVPIPIPAKWQVPSSASGEHPMDQPPVNTASVSHAEEPAAIQLQPQPLLDVKIHFNQPVPETPAIPKDTTPAAQSPVARLAAQPASASPVVGTTSTLPAPIPAVTTTPVPAAPVSSVPVIVAPAATPPFAVPPAVVPPLVATPVAAAPSPVALVTTGSVVTAPVIAIPSVPAPVPVDAPLITQGTQKTSTRQQDPERGSPEHDDVDAGQVLAANERPVPRIADAPAAVAAQPQKQDAGSPPLPPHNGVVPMPASPIAPTMTEPAPMTGTEAKAATQTANAALREEPVADQTRMQQPIRSLALEFTPDGAGDIKVRLSEKAGDVHISLHGTDPSLAGRVREGVSDLVGSLSKAGYDAEAWTPGHGRQNQRQESDQRKTPRSASGTAGAEEFNGMLQQPLQEIS
jgi:hypothetical protein